VSSHAVLILVSALAIAGLGLAAFLLYIWVRYSSIIARIFTETPVFAPLRATPVPADEDVTITTADGFQLAGIYFRTTAPHRLGVVVFCTEYLGDRWSALPYADGLREAGFDLFSFDFRNHGDSQSDPSYQPLQWVSDLELTDLRAVLNYLRSRPDADPAGVALFGLSRGGGTALAVAGEDPTVWALATDGAFPTHGTMLSYILRWAEIYVRGERFWKCMPRFIFSFAAWAGRITTERQRGRSYPKLERAARKLGPRPWLLIHGEKDAYIGPQIALGLFAHAGEPKESWIVPRAKHNRCREKDPAAYRARLVEFFTRYAPRQAPVLVAPEAPALEPAPSEPAPTVTVEVSAPASRESESRVRRPVVRVR
jgi:pimeloyl-ACP methyl ester carboxylesterase